jgi:hypothetical protein
MINGFHGFHAYPWVSGPDHHPSHSPFPLPPLLLPPHNPPITPLSSSHSHPLSPLLSSLKSCCMSLGMRATCYLLHSYPFWFKSDVGKRYTEPHLHYASYQHIEKKVVKGGDHARSANRANSCQISSPSMSNCSANRAGKGSQPWSWFHFLPDAKSPQDARIQRCIAHGHPRQVAQRNSEE